MTSDILVQQYMYGLMPGGRRPSCGAARFMFENVASRLQKVALLKGEHLKTFFGNQS